MDPMASQKQFEPASGSRDFLAAELETREHAFATVREVFGRYGFEPLQTPAFERLEVLTGKYGDEGDKLIFKILRRGLHEVTGDADLALRYDLTVPLARVVAAYGNQLPTPYKRYAIGPVWRADRPGKGRFREFTQCDIDIVGSTSSLADAEVLLALNDALAALGVPEYQFLLNSRQALFGLLEAFQVPLEAGPGALITLDKLDKLAPDDVVAELVDSRGLPIATAEALVAELTAEDVVDGIRAELKSNDMGQAGLESVDRTLALIAGQVPDGRVVFAPNLVRGLDYYTGVIFEVVAPGMPGSIASGGRYDGLIAQLGGPDLPSCGGSLGIERILPLVAAAKGEQQHARIDVAVTIMGEEFAGDSFTLAGRIRAAGVRTGVYLGSSGKLGKQLKWASDQGARYAVIYGASDRDAGAATVRDMVSGEQTQVRLDQIGSVLARRIAEPVQAKST
jgi:histidyl-tRNA synthetase